jgi:CubicO group peptidase (beta-lactamase class C family)
MYMKTNYRFFYVITLLLGFLVMGCDEGDEPGQDETDGSNKNEMFFPPAGDEGWETVTAEEIGWDTANLNEAIRYAKEKRSSNLLVIYKGRFVVEEYWRQTTATSQHDLNSIAKSMMALVVGVLQQDGTINIDDKVSKYLPAGWSLAPEVEGNITIRHLLTMTSGLNEELKSVGPPGETWRYSHAAFRVLFDVIKSAKGSSARDYFDSVLSKKIGMTNYTWTGYDLSSSGREIARFGLLMLNDGVWNGEKLISDDGYYKAMLQTSQSLQEAYGYLWWLNGTDTWYDDDTKTTVNGSIAASMPEDGFIAKGKHDQRIYIVPSLDLVVIRQGAFTELPESGEGSFDAEFWMRLMKAIKPNNNSGT